MSLGSTGAGGIQGSASAPPPDRPEDAFVDPSKISFAGVLAQLFQGQPQAASAPDPSAAAPDPSAVAAPQARETQPPEKPEEAPKDDAPEAPEKAKAPKEERNDPPAESAETRQTSPLAPPAQGTAQQAAQPPTQPTDEAPAPVVTPPALPDLKGAAQPEPKDSGEPASPTPTAPQDPATAGGVAPHDPQPTTPAAPPPAPEAPPLLVQHALGHLDAPAIGPAPAPDAATPPVDAPKAPSSQDAPPPVDPGVRVDAVSIAAQAAPVVVAPAGRGSDAGLDANGGRGGNADAIAAPGGATRTAQGDFAGDLAEAAGARRPDPAQMVDRVARGMRLSMASGQTRMKLLLSPPRLGSLTVELEMKHGVLSAHLTAETAEAQDLLARNMAALTNSLREQGINVGAFTVGARHNGGGGGAQAGGHGGSGAPTYAGSEAAAADDVRAYADERRRLSLQDQIVDLMA